MNENTHCPVCFEEFDLTQHIPRIFPCFDTIYQTRIIDLLGKTQTQLTCPLCRSVHQSHKKGYKAFQQNKYILVNLQLKDSKPKKESTSEELQHLRCKKHNRDLTVFCENETCMKSICSRCLTLEHKLHKIINIEDQHKKYLAIVQNAIVDMTRVYDELVRAKSKMEEAFGIIQVLRESTKKELSKFTNGTSDECKRECEGMETKHTFRMQEDVDFLEEKITLLHDILGESNNQYSETYDLTLIENIKLSIYMHIHHKLSPETMIATMQCRQHCR